ncbi:MAG: lipoyl(octanoyl) transferase LipB [Bacteroidota bacterium]
MTHPRKIKKRDTELNNTRIRCCPEDVHGENLAGLKEPRQPLQLITQHWGCIPYLAAWHRQEALHATLVAAKMEQAKTNSLSPKPMRHYLIFCEHPPVYTLGKGRVNTSLHIDEPALYTTGATFVYANRGGHITYHGPGQLMLYLITDLATWCQDIHRYLRLLEEIVIRSLQDFHLVGERRPPQTGVWLDAQNPQDARKLCAVGIRVSKWVSMHGLALNVYPDLHYFDHITPCGLRNSQVTSMEVELRKLPDMQRVVAALTKHTRCILGGQPDVAPS